MYHYNEAMEHFGAKIYEEARINDIVYSLYGLSEGKIKVIERK